MGAPYRPGPPCLPRGGTVSGPGAGEVVSECAVATKKHPRKKLLATLRESLEAGTPVQVQRSVDPEEVLEGVVLELSEEWVLLAGLREGAYLNGYHALRVKDLVDVESETRFLPFLQRHQTWPPARPAVEFELSDLRSIVTVGASVAGVVSIYREAKWPGTVLIGAPIEWTKKSLWLLPITPRCHWEDHMVQVRLKDLTQVGFGGDYEAAVLEVAGSVPPRSHTAPHTA